MHSSNASSVAVSVIVKKICRRITNRYMFNKEPACMMNAIAHIVSSRLWVQSESRAFANDLNSADKLASHVSRDFSHLRAFFR